MGAALRSFRDELSATVVRVFAYIGAITVIVVAAFRIFGSAPVEAAIDPLPRSGWAAIDRPYRAFALNIPEFSEPEGDYAIWRHTDGGRKDVLTWGETAGARLRVEIYRPGREIKQFGDPVSEVVARAAEMGSDTALTPSEPIDSKFGRIALYDFKAGGEPTRHCVGFVRAFQDPRLQIAGWYCKAADEVVERAPLACALDRLSLLAAASEPKVQELFAHAELKRKFCNPKSAQRAAGLKRHDWIDAGSGPKLRGRFAGR